MSRYLVQQPMDLESLAMAKLGDWIAPQAEQMMSPISKTYIHELFQRDVIKAEEWLSLHIEIIRSFLYYSLPSMFYDKLVIEAIRALSALLHRCERFSRKSPSPSLDWKIDDDVDNNELSLFQHPKQMNIIGRMIETLFTENLTCLSLDYEAMETFAAPFYAKSHMLTGLTRLDLDLGRIEEEAKTIQSIKELHSLKYLSLGFCTNNILKCIATNCKLIESLSLTESYISDEDIEILAQLPNLKSIEFNETDVDQKGIETILISCENIKYIGVAFEVLECAIEHLVSLEEYNGKRFSLHTINICGEAVTVEQLLIILQTCPQIQNIILEKGWDEPTLLTFPEDFKYLQELLEMELRGFLFYTEKVENLLKAIGYNLVHLELNLVEQIDLNALKSINQSCPNLEKFIISSVTLLSQSFVKRGLFYCNLIVSNTKPFMNLKRLTISDINWEAQPTEEHLLFLLFNCPNVEFVSLDSLILTDDIVLKVLNKNPLVYLKELKIWHSKLSNSVIDRIIQNCVNTPEAMICGK